MSTTVALVHQVPPWRHVPSAVVEAHACRGTDPLRRRRRGHEPAVFTQRHNGVCGWSPQRRLRDPMNKIPPPEDNRRPFFTARTLAAYVTLSERTVRQMLADHVIPSYRIQGARRIAAADVDTYLVHRREGGA